MLSHCRISKKTIMMFNVTFFGRSFKTSGHYANSSRMKHCSNTGIWVVHCIQGEPWNNQQSSPRPKKPVNHPEIKNAEQLITDIRHACTDVRILASECQRQQCSTNQP
jgi:hypothetical protein